MYKESGKQSVKTGIISGRLIAALEWQRITSSHMLP